MTIFTNKPTLHGDKITLRPFKENDWKIMANLLNDIEVQKLTGSTSSSNLEQMSDEDLLQLKSWYDSRSSQKDRLDLGIVIKENNQLIGEVVLNDWDEESQSCNFRILISSEQFGNGYGTQATKLIIKYAFENLGLNRIELDVYDFNPRAHHVYQKVGFQHEGTKRETLIYDGKWINSHMMAILKSDYEVMLNEQTNTLSK